MGSKATDIVLLFCAILVSITRTEAIDINAMLKNQPDYELFSILLSQTGLAANINSREPVTVLLLDNDAVLSILTKPLVESRNILSTHIILDYYDEEKLKDFHGSVLLTTLFQTTGVAGNGQGFLNMTATENAILVRSGAADAALSSKVVKCVDSEPYNIALLQIDQPIFTPGISQVPPSTSLSPPPISLVPTPAYAPYGPTPASTPTPTPAPFTVPALHYEHSSPVPAPAPSLYFDIANSIPVPAPYMGVPSSHEGPSPIPALAPHEGPTLVSSAMDGPAPALAPFVGPVPAYAPSTYYGSPLHAPTPTYDDKAHEILSPEPNSPLAHQAPHNFGPEYSPKNAPASSPRGNNDAPSPQYADESHVSLSPDFSPQYAEVYWFGPEHSPKKAPAPSPMDYNEAPRQQDDDKAHEILSPESESPLAPAVHLFGPEHSPMEAPAPSPNDYNEAPSPQEDDKEHEILSPESESPIPDQPADDFGPEHSPKKAPSPTPEGNNDVPADISTPAKLKITNGGESLRNCNAAVLVAFVGLVAFTF